MDTLDVRVQVGGKPERHGTVLDLAGVRLRAVRPRDVLLEPAGQPEGPRTILAGVLLRGVLGSDVTREIGEQPERRITVQAHVRLPCVMPSGVDVEVAAPPERHGAVLADVRLGGVLPGDVLFEVLEQREPGAAPRVRADVRSPSRVDRRAVPLEVLGTREPLLARRADVRPLALDRSDVHREVSDSLIAAALRLEFFDASPPSTPLLSARGELIAEARRVAEHKAASGEMGVRPLSAVRKLLHECFSITSKRSSCVNFITQMF